MDVVAYSHADAQAVKISKFVADPNSVAGMITLPNNIPVGESITIPTGRTVIHPNLSVDGSLTIEGDGSIFVPAGGSFTPALFDSVVVKQNGEVVLDVTDLVNTPLTGSPTVNGSALPTLDTAQDITAEKNFTAVPKINGSKILAQDIAAYNADTSTFISNTLSSGAIIERGSNANGEYVKFADGSAIAWHFIANFTTLPRTDSLPMDFVGLGTSSITLTAWANPSVFITMMINQDPRHITSSISIDASTHSSYNGTAVIIGRWK